MSRWAKRQYRGFSGFPAGSLPSRRFLPYVDRKSMIEPSFSA
jgi:hypothetical protein